MPEEKGAPTPKLPGQSEGKESGVAQFAATVLAATWVAATLLLYIQFVHSNHVDAWDRALVLYNGLTAVGFTAIGVLLGTQVQQVNAVVARRDATVARAEASAAKAETADIRGKAKALVHSVSESDVGGGKVDPSTRLAKIQKDLIELL